MLAASGRACPDATRPRELAKPTYREIKAAPGRIAESCTARVADRRAFLPPMGVPPGSAETGWARPGVPCVRRGDGGGWRGAARHSLGLGAIRLLAVAGRVHGRGRHAHRDRGTDRPVRGPRTYSTLTLAGRGTSQASGRARLPRVGPCRARGFRSGTCEYGANAQGRYTTATDGQPREPVYRIAEQSSLPLMRNPRPGRTTW